MQEALGVLPADFKPVYFDADAKRRRRQLLQSSTGGSGGVPEYTAPQVNVAQQMKIISWDRSVGEQNVDGAAMFLRVFGRQYGGNMTSPAVVNGLRALPCSATAEIYNLKLEILREYNQLTAAKVTSTQLVTQASCALPAMLATPGEVSEDAQRYVIEIFKTRILTQMEDALNDPGTAASAAKLEYGELVEGATAVPQKGANCIHWLMLNLAAAVEARCEPSGDIEKQMARRDRKSVV